MAADPSRQLWQIIAMKEEAHHMRAFGLELM